MMEHPNEDVRQSLIRLNDALCTWERTTNRQSVLILREDGGFIHRSLSGKPYKNDVFPTDEELFKQVQT